MLNLQTITESLATICQGRAWVFVTSQGELRNVLGELRKEEGDDFTKIQGRFKTRLTLTSADVREVIQKRLLAKREAEPEVLTTLYDAEKENLRTLYRFGEGSVEYKGWRGSDEFCAYPLGHLAEFADELLVAKEDLLAPVKAFMHGLQRRTYDEVLAFYREEAANFGEIEAAELEPLRLLAESKTPFRGAVLPNARAAMTRLRGLIDQRLATERATALAMLDQREAQLRDSEEFKKLDRERQAQVLAKSTEARATITQARFMAAICDRIARYHAQDYPAQLDLAAKLAAPSQVTEQPNSILSDPRYVRVSGLKVSCRLPYIASEADLDEWLTAMRQVAVEELLKGNRISL